MIVTSAGSAMTLLGSTGSVLSATEKEKEMQIQLIGPTGGMHS